MATGLTSNCDSGLNMLQVGYVLLSGERGYGCVAYRIGDLSHQLRTQVSGCKQSRYARLHAIVGDQVAAYVVGRMVFQKVGVRFEADKDEYPLRGMLPRFAGLHIPQHNSIDFFVALYLLNHRVPADVGFWVVEDLVLKNLLRSKLGS